MKMKTLFFMICLGSVNMINAPEAVDAGGVAVLSLQEATQEARELKAKLTDIYKQIKTNYLQTTFHIRSVQSNPLTNVSTDLISALKNTTEVESAISEADSVFDSESSEPNTEPNTQLLTAANLQLDDIIQRITTIVENASKLEVFSQKLCLFCNNQLNTHSEQKNTLDYKTLEKLTFETRNTVNNLSRAVKRYNDKILQIIT